MALLEEVLMGFAGVAIALIGFSDVDSGERSPVYWTLLRYWGIPPKRSRTTIQLSHKVVTVIALVVLLSMLASSFGYIRSYQLTFCLGLITGTLASVHNFYLLLFPAPEEVP